MSAFLDSNVIVRYLTGEPPDLAERSAEIIDRQDDLRVPEVVLAETACVLTSVHGVSREAVVDHLMAFMQKRNIGSPHLERSLVLQALSLCRPPGRVSFADALLWATAYAREGGTVYSFDKRFPSDGITVLDG